MCNNCRRSHYDGKTLIIAILVALILLWFAETLNMKKTSKILGGAIDLGFAILR